MHQDKMEVTSFDNYRLAPPGWSDSLPPESDDELKEAFLSDVDTDTPAAQPAPLRHFFLPMSDNYIERAKCREVF